METIKLHEHQKVAISQLKTGSILWGGVGSGKSLTSLAYYLEKENTKDLYIITTAGKRDKGEWTKEAERVGVVPIKIDSWNNIGKYEKIENSFFIFDEQRVIGSGSWVKSFLKITKRNNWILLSATPGDTWADYIPVFIANGFYKNRSDFVQQHIVWNAFTKFRKIDRYIETGKLIKFRNSILVRMEYEKKTTANKINHILPYDENVYSEVVKKRWNPFTEKPILEISEYCQVLRKISNSNPARFSRVMTLINKHKKVIIFYNFNYELDILRDISNHGIKVAEYNGHKHEPIPDTISWAYLVQYIAGSEGWNCIETNTIIFYSLNYSYRTMTQAGGRIDRLNTPFANLYYHWLFSNSSIDKAILRSLSGKKDFNERLFLEKKGDWNEQAF